MKLFNGYSLKKYILIKNVSFFFFLFLLSNSNLVCQNKKIKNLPLRKRTFNIYSTEPKQSIIDVSNITSWVSDNGFHEWRAANKAWNGSYPNGKNAGTIFSEGIVWGGLVYDNNDTIVRVNGNAYVNGTKAITRIFRVRADYKIADLARDAANYFNKPFENVTNSDVKKIYNQYDRDWHEWPASEGAIYDDVDNDGVFNPAVDIPGVPDAAQTIFIKYDDSKSFSSYHSPVIGLEVSETYWAYSNSGVFNNAVFKKVDIVYKGTKTSNANSHIDSMYICQWSDTDLGNPNDDFSGCDTILNLGYTYNSDNNDKVFSELGMTPPAVGYVILQGVAKYTGNPNDSAIVNLKWRKGYKYINSKPLSTFINSASGGLFADPGYSYKGTLEFYNYLRGRLPIPRYPTGIRFPSSIAVTTVHGSYLLPGDPLTGTGIVDGQIDGPGDRRIWLVTGPFSLHLSDTAEVITALVVGQGYSNLNSVSKLKKNTRVIKKVFDSLVFRLPSIKRPEVAVIALHNKIILNWENNLELYNTIENFSKGNYNFEGYEVYQFPSKSSTIEEGVKIGQFDLKNGITTIYDTVKDVSWVNIPKLKIIGKDNGITGFMSITRDTLNKTTLIDGSTYYFGVVAYAVNKSSVFSSHIIRSPLKIIEAVPQTSNPLVSYNSDFGDTLVAKHFGDSEGKLIPIVVDPSRTNGKTYKVTFDTLNGDIVWDMKYNDTGEIILNNQTNQSGDNNYPIVEGILAKVISPPKAIKEIKYKHPTWIYGHNWGGSHFYGGMDIGKNFWKETSPIYNYVPIELRFTGGEGKEIPNKANGWSQGAVYRKDKNYEYTGVGWIPITAWDVSDSLNPRQVNISFIEDSVNGNTNLKWDMGLKEGSNHYLAGNEYLIISNTDYNPFFYNEKNNALKKDNMYFLWAVQKSSYKYLAFPFKIKILPNKINSINDVYEFTAPEVTIKNTLSEKDIEKINVFPNPYYTTESVDYVTFNHLPDNAIIRIFDLSGVIIKTIIHQGKDKQFERWHLSSNNNIYVASGIYIAQIDMPKLNKRKILKLAIVSKY